ncbi:DUF4267 domain-containing protein [Pseudonocardia cypriaca]|uniref:Uncharacterized protein DUF4267 n=1 Tax=Pseudonocardia cypriaca TaxID=882449 RepID=A0A543FUH3_9PSEU|nr:DUF4267 domain-containing protein [Pseudonocardia cypriaca]TQM37497.1 uncharacterized protein DUF4267 [Pseudonocardia cypriaca]
MWLHRIALVVAGLIGVGIIFIGLRFLLDPAAAAVAFGVPAPAADDPFLAVKGVRDIGSGLILLTLLALRRPHVLGWVTLAASSIPIGDALIVLANGGPAYAAYGIHGATAVVAIATAAVLVSGRAGRPVPRGSAAPAH